MKEMTVSEVHDKVDAFVVRLRTKPPSVNIGDVVELAQLLQATLRAMSSIVESVTKIQSLHNTVLEEYRLRVERLERLTPVKAYITLESPHDA